MGEDGIQGSSSGHGRGAQGPLSASFLIGIAIEMIVDVLNFPPESMVPKQGPQQHVCRVITIQYIQIENLEMSTVVNTCPLLYAYRLLCGHDNSLLQAVLTAHTHPKEEQWH